MYAKLQFYSNFIKSIKIRKIQKTYIKMFYQEVKHFSNIWNIIKDINILNYKNVRFVHRNFESM
jgi:hypothetical protein